VSSNLVFTIYSVGYLIPKRPKTKNQRNRFHDSDEETDILTELPQESKYKPVDDNLTFSKDFIAGMLLLGLPFVRIIVRSHA
jgi:hypothetical protein